MLTEYLCRELDYGAALQRAKRLIKHPKTMIDMDTFLDKLAEKEFLSVAQERTLKSKKNEYCQQIDDTFFILFEWNPELVHKSIVDILGEMKRNDLKMKLENEMGEIYCRMRTFT